MERIIQENIYFECRYCEGIVYANNPTCSKCGLEMSSEGVNELAKIKATNYEAMRMFWVLRQSSAIYTLLSIIALIFSTITIYKFVFWMIYPQVLTVGIFYIMWKYFYSQVTFDSADEEKLKNYKRNILIFVVFNLFSGVVFYFLNY